MKDEIENAKITHVSITMADHGCLTFYLTLEGDGWGVNYGGVSIGTGYVGAKDFKGDGKGLEAMMRIMDIVGVTNWEDLEGKYCRIVNPDWGGVVKVIGNILKDKWFDIDKFYNGDDKE